MEREDTQPWYRQFWPWFIMALPASAVVAGLFTLWISMQTGDSLVVQSSDGMNIVTERNLAAEKEAERLGLSAAITIDLESGAVSMTMSARDNVQLPATLELRFRHPTMASRDATVQLLQAMPTNNGQPTWAGHFVAPPKGRYYMTLSSGDSWRLGSEWSGQSEIIVGLTGQPGHVRR